MATLTLPLLHAGESSSVGRSAFIEEAQEDEFLSPDVAFKLDLSVIDAENLNADFKTVPGYYLYKDRIKFVIKDANTGKIQAVNLPAGEIKDDPNFGKQEVYHHDFDAKIQLSAANNPVIQATYQGCSEKGLCYAPVTKIIEIALPKNGNNVSDIAVSNADEDKTTQALKGGNLWLIIGVFFIAGLLLSFTPCVLPMIPILSSIIVGSQAKRTQPSKLHAFSLSVAYVLGMALSYTLAGIAAGLSGNLLSQSLQTPWALGATALIFVALAFSMFGFYELKLPAAFENKILGASQKLKGGEFLGVFVMGILSALIVSPCVAAPLAGALIYIGQTNNVLLGGVGLFALAIGMGVPLLLIGASAGSLLPKTGSWMTVVRNFFGVLMLAMAAYLVWPVLPASVTAPVNQLLGNSAEHNLPFTRIKNTAELDSAIQAANGKIVMLDFYADWCVACKEMERFTFSDTKVKTALKDAVLLQADVTENNTADQALLKRFGLFGPPGIIFFDIAGNEIKPKVIGYKNTNDFLKILNKVNQP
ncbi:protein-disulfide reductase DsbD [Methylotenera versatilis]|uniref:protein-disulfide reductase DsbD n=1 Tax=Methylotenera versatilis TaxID=1055487 RepID=UPI000AF13549|nr:protein-disulfide reductase DsbD [Methylotenera versatilis]